MPRNSFATDPFSETTIGAMIAEHGGSIKTGPFGTTLKAAEYSREGVPLISVGEIGYGTISVHDKTPRVSALVTNRLPEYLLEFGDIVFGRKGAVDRSALVRREQAGWFLGSDGIRLRLPKGPNAPCDPVFIAYCLQEKQHRAWILQHATGTTMASLNQGIIERVPIPLPPLPEQRAIAAVLGALDDKIEVNRKTARVLEGIARAVFQSWFVDFDPVRYNIRQREHAALGRAGRFVSTGDDFSVRDAAGELVRRGGDALYGKVAHLFPDRLVDSPLGEVPEGWRVGTLGEVMTLDKGLSYKGQFLADVGIPMVNLGCLKGSGRFDENSFKHYTGDHQPRHLVHARDLVIANTDITQKREVIGSPALVPPDGDDKFLFTHHVFAARFNPGMQAWKLFVYFLLLQDTFRERAAGFATGTTVLALPRDAVLQLSFPKPSEQVVERFTSFVTPLVEKPWLLAAENRALAALRDTLLPKLISGELRIADAEKIVGRAV